MFVTDFSGTTKAVKMKLSTHMDNGLMYRVYQNQGQGSITLGVTSLYRFYNLLLMKKMSHFPKNCKVCTELILGTHMHSGLMCCVYRNQDQGLLELSPVIGFTVYHQ